MIDPTSPLGDTLRRSIRRFWNKPPNPTFCSACKKKVPVQRGPAPGMFGVAPCPHCGSNAGWTSTFTTGGRDAKEDINLLLAEVERLAALVRAVPLGMESESLAPEQVQLLAWAVSNCHTLARRRIRAGVDLEYWEHVQRICEKAGARSKGVLPASVPTEITEGSEPVND